MYPFTVGARVGFEMVGEVLGSNEGVTVGKTEGIETDGLFEGNVVGVMLGWSVVGNTLG